MSDILGYRNLCSMCRKSIEKENEIVCDNKESQFYGLNTEGLLLAPCFIKKDNIIENAQAVSLGE